MMRLFPESQRNILGIELSKKVTKKDYRDFLAPAFDRVVAEHGMLRVLFDFTDDFQGFELAIIYEDARFVLHHLKQFERVALINSPEWIKPLLVVFEWLTKCPVRTFSKNEHLQAWAFIEGVD